MLVWSQGNKINCAHSVEWMAYSCFLLNHTLMLYPDCVCRRGQIACPCKCVTLPYDAAGAADWKDVFTVVVWLHVSQEKHSPLAGSCRKIEESWLVGRNWQVTMKLGTKQGIKNHRLHFKWTCIVGGSVVIVSLEKPGKNSNGMPWYQVIQSGQPEQLWRWLWTVGAKAIWTVCSHNSLLLKVLDLNLFM